MRKIVYTSIKQLFVLIEQPPTLNTVNPESIFLKYYSHAVYVLIFGTNLRNNLGTISYSGA